MQKNVDKVFKGEKVNLDFSEYEHCMFDNCEIHVEYGITNVVNCEFNQCRLHLHGPALNVAEIIRLFSPESFPMKKGQ